MKKLLLLTALFTLFSCSKKVDSVASFEFNGAWYWVVQYEPDATKKEIEDYVNTWANPKQTSHFFVFDNSLDLSVFKKQAFNFNSFAATVLANKPKYGFYKMPPDNKLNADAVWLLEQSQKK